MTWDQAVTTLRLRLERDGDDDAADDGAATDPLRAVSRVTLGLLADDSDAEAVAAAAALRDIAAEATSRDLAAEQVVGAATSTARSAWELLVDAEPGAEELSRSGRRILRALEVLGTRLAEGYAAADLELATQYADARRGFLDELLGMAPRDRSEALRRRRRAERYGLDVAGSFRLTIASPGARARDADLDAMVRDVRSALGGPSTTREATLRLPAVSQLNGRLVVLDLPGSHRIEVLRRAFERALETFPRRWVAIVGPEVPQFDGLAAAMSRLREAARTAELVGRSGWVPGTSELDLETLMSLDDSLRRLAIEAELGPLLRDARLGTELLTTLEAYFATGQNAREAARQLHVAPRTVTYRLQRIRQLRGRPEHADSMLRLAVAVFAYGLDRHQRVDRPHRGRPHGGAP